MLNEKGKKKRTNNWGEPMNAKPCNDTTHVTHKIIKARFRIVQNLDLRHVRLELMDERVDTF